MKNQKNSTKLLFATALAILVFAALTSATSTLSSPVINGNYTSAITVNCTTTLNNVTSMSFFYNATGVSTALIKTVTNISANQTNFNASAVSVASLADKEDYTFWCSTNGGTFQNSTAVQQNSSYSANTGITIDNTAPICQITVASPTIEYQQVQPISWNISDDAGTALSTAASITGPNATATLYTDAISSHTLGSGITGVVASIGTWVVDANATNRVGLTCSNQKNFTIAYGGQAQSAQTQGTTTTAKPINWTLVAGVLIVLGIVFLVTKKK